MKLASTWCSVVPAPVVFLTVMIGVLVHDWRARDCLLVVGRELSDYQRCGFDFRGLTFEQIAEDIFDVWSRGDIGGELHCILLNGKGFDDLR
ncbi:hypothetical protein PAB09_00195 [Corynebacterium sp. SCR221107]|uniref:hypothetical protein n=1 Tax=Corynebacterium sp. SCR221107 TaxID=3017361 RepID=UPI0022EC53CE|nr:hypothetical protein [Corynebacterium sp. SCR221107]WBT08823.1 hypothetical protein PAB09_00195 [Corynebacterium sp. SCR221107]